ncbi:PDZ domain-containing protein [Novosphingobium beihaiensis]|uniref:PDZ domain-containing protein n=1 Tax=Novosphingobium beihaiensis TaxID=2930389 RepID=A0ABT0BPH3_9SPHN|nr:hypothetical protein [Novosphingobium beihaiensis]MCJ2186956.1 hypothetical protein [Novosphingobium beihaiensis]
MPIDRRTFVSCAGGAALAGLVPPQAAWAVSGAGGTIDIPIHLTPGRVLVSCMADGEGPFPFVFDTGGTVGLIDMKLVEALKLKRVGGSRLSLSIGTKVFPIYEVRDLIFGGKVRQPSAVFAGVKNFGFGEGVRGSLAAGVLSSVTGELDYENQIWRIYQDETPDRTGWTRYDKALVKSGNRNGSSFLFADAVLGGTSLRLGLDTGMPSALRIYRKAAEAAGLWKWDSQRWTPTAPGGKGRLIRTDVTLAGTVLKDVPVSLVEDVQWSTFHNGIIGLPVLRLFNMATHAAKDELYLRRNALPAATHLNRYNRAGIWIGREHGGLIAEVVGAGSPAAQAGIKAGDRILDADFGDLIERFQGPAGSRVPLRLQTDGAVREVTLTLEDFL